MESSHLLEAVVSAIGEWERDILFALVWRGSQVRVCAVDVSELESLLSRSLETEEVVAIDDLTKLGGCSVDFSPAGDDLFEMMICAWGSHESTATVVAKKLGSQTFRGN